MSDAEYAPQGKVVRPRSTTVKKSTTADADTVAKTRPQRRASSRKKSAAQVEVSAGGQPASFLGSNPESIKVYTAFDSTADSAVQLQAISDFKQTANVSDAPEPSACHETGVGASTSDDEHVILQLRVSTQESRKEQPHVGAYNEAPADSFCSRPQGLSRAGGPFPADGVACSNRADTDIAASPEGLRDSSLGNFGSFEGVGSFESNAVLGRQAVVVPAGSGLEPCGAIVDALSLPTSLSMDSESKTMPSSMSSSMTDLATSAAADLHHAQSAPLSGPMTRVMGGSHKADATATDAHQATESVRQSATSAVRRLLMDFEEKSKAGEWPSTTSVHCHWCCHRFDTVPFGLPVKFARGMFHVRGCFCSLECAAAQNFASVDSLYDVFERYHLLNSLASHLGLPPVVKAAPSRTVLNMFGGPMSIAEFRSFSVSNKVLIVNFPPMLSAQQQVEEINETELRSEYRFVPLDNDRVNRYQEKIKLRRTKPLVNYKNTLDSTMNLRYH